MGDIYVGVIFLFDVFYWSPFFDVHFSYCEVFMCQVLGVTQKQCYIDFKKHIGTSISRGPIQKIITKWNEASSLRMKSAEDQDDPKTREPTKTSPC